MTNGRVRAPGRRAGGGQAMKEAASGVSGNGADAKPEPAKSPAPAPGA